MKKLILLLLAIILVKSCKNESKVEILQNNEKDYHRDFEVNRLPAFADTSYSQMLSEGMINLVEDYFPEDTGKTLVIPLYYELYLSEKGEVEKIKNITKKTDVDNYNADGAILLEPSQIDRQFSNLVTNWKFIPALKNGNAVKHIIELRASVMKMKNGTIIWGVKTENEYGLFRNFNIFDPRSNDKTNVIQTGETDDSEFFVAVEEMPEPIGGINEIAKHVRYPEIAKRAGIQGRVFVKALIDEKGSVVGTSIIKGIGAGCDQAAMEAVMQSRFKPGRQKGKPVKVQVTIPILFKLQ